VRWQFSSITPSQRSWSPHIGEALTLGKWLKLEGGNQRGIVQVWVWSADLRTHAAVITAAGCPCCRVD